MEKLLWKINNNFTLASTQYQNVKEKVDNLKRMRSAHLTQEVTVYPHLSFILPQLQMSKEKLNSIKNMIPKNSRNKEFLENAIIHQQDLENEI